jgi:hypothetical protein
MGIKVDLICWNIYTYSCHHQSPIKLQSNCHRLAQQVTIQISINESIKTEFCVTKQESLFYPAASTGHFI